MSSEKFNATMTNIDGIPVVKLDSVELFDVRRVFDCGQCFRFDPFTASRHEV